MQKIVRDARRFNPRTFLFSYGFYVVMFLIFLVFATMGSNFLKFETLAFILHSSAWMFVIGTGVALVIMTGNIDISVGSVAYVTALLGGVMWTFWRVPPPLALVVMILVGAAIGAFNGFVVNVLRVNSLIATLGMMISLRGVGLHIQDPRFQSLPQSLREFGLIRIGPVFLDVFIGLAVVLLAQLMLTRTRFGRHIMAVGNGPEIASRLGVRVDRTRFLAFVLSGTLAAFGGIVYILQVQSIDATVGDGLEFTAVAAVVIGGVSLFGGQGSIFPGVMFGAITLSMINAGLVLMSASPFAVQFARGFMIFLSMWADSWRMRVRTQVKVGEIEPAAAAPAVQAAGPG
jgi:ribose/xylose/arabinose/galactoside ABC-type transport system permease subunit